MWRIRTRRERVWIVLCNVRLLGLHSHVEVGSTRSLASIVGVDMESLETGEAAHPSGKRSAAIVAI